MKEQNRPCVAGPLPPLGIRTPSAPIQEGVGAHKPIQDGKVLGELDSLSLMGLTPLRRRGKVEQISRLARRLIRDLMVEISQGASPSLSS